MFLRQGLKSHVNYSFKSMKCIFQHCSFDYIFLLDSKSMNIYLSCRLFPVNIMTFCLLFITLVLFLSYYFYNLIISISWVLNFITRIRFWIYISSDTLTCITEYKEISSFSIFVTTTTEVKQNFEH